MVDLDDYVQRAITTPVAGPPALRELERRSDRHRRTRFTRRVAAAGAAAGVIILVVLILTQQTSPRVVISSGPTSAPRGWSTYRDDAHGLSISYPSSWHPAASTLTPVLVDPVVPIALGTYPLEAQRLGECDIVPQRALRALGPRDAFIAVYVYDGLATGNFATSRPDHFGPRLPWSTGPIQCTDHVRGRVEQLTFTDNSRHLAVLIAVGAHDTRQRQQEIYRILDTLHVKQPTP